MKILILHQYFKTPKQGGGIRSYHIARAMVHAGHQVTVITASNDKNKSISFEGINIHYLNVPYANHYSLIKRLWAFWTFYRKALSKSRSIENSELVYAISTPLTVGWLGKNVSAMMGARFFFEVGDLWPEVPIQLGVIKNSLFKNWLYDIEKRIYQSAETVIALSSGMVGYIESSGAKKVIVIPNMADIEYFSSTAKAPKRETTFTIGYFGTIGLANHLEYMVDIAKLSEKENLDIRFIIVGEGARKSAITQQILSRHLKNVTMHTWQDMAGVKLLMGECDAVYVSFQSIEVLHTGSPNKFFDGLAAGKVIISNLGGWSKSVIEQNDVGLAYDPTIPEEFLEKILPLLSDKSRVALIKRNAIRLAQTSFDKELLTRRMLGEIG